MYSVMKSEQHVLVVFPHPDDEAFGVSGTIMTHLAEGTPVTYACLTLGEMGRNLGNPPFATRESLPFIRKQELEDAARVMGVEDVRMLGIRDKTVEFLNDRDLTDRITALLDELQPSKVITFYPGYSVHPDHDATGRAVVRAVGRIPKEQQPTLHCVAFSKNCVDELGPPNIVHDVSRFMQRKIETVKAHKSQTQLTTSTWEEKIADGDTEMIQWITNERFWTYQW